MKTLVAAVIGVLGTTLLAATATAQSTLALPAPTGAYPVGVVDLHLRDDRRADPWVPDRKRELMVSLWFPATSRHGTPDQYVNAAESRLILQRIGAPGVPPEALATVRTHARTGVRPLPAPSGRPLVVLSPGFSFPRSSLTALAEELASRGYVVAGVDHTYEAAAITFPDGRITECLVCTMVQEELVEGSDVTASRAADISFVLDRLTARPGIDGSRIAVIGHSIGGTSAAETMLRDRRVDAGVNLDGSFQPPVTTALRRPFLMVEAANHSATDTSWGTTWPNLTGWRRWIKVTDTTHSTFTDYGILGEQVGLPVQPMTGDLAGEITRKYLTAFVDRHLRQRPAPLLNGPSAQYPDVVFRP